MWHLLGTAVLIFIAFVLAPFLVLSWVAFLTWGFVVRARALAPWPRGKIALVAYAHSEVWGPYIESRLLPDIARSCVVVDRSNPGWKRSFPLERRLIHHFGERREDNPVAIVLRTYRPAKVLRTHSHFRDAHFGKSAGLDTVILALRTALRQANPDVA